MVTKARVVIIAAILLAVGTFQARTASQGVGGVTSPLEQFGARIGDDYFLATYAQFETYWKRLDAQSDRMRLVDIGRTEEGRTQWMAIVSAPENFANLDRYKEISRRLALAEGLTEAQARALAREGRSIVWIDGGQHANEVLGAQQLIEMVYQLVSRSDEETQRILRDVIVLAAHANPDGHALVADWYMREREPRLRTLTGIPRLYQKYVGHDNNRDFFLSSQVETVNINRVLYRDWFPQIVYSHHQAGPPGTVMFAPPFRGPFNYLFDPLVPSTIDLMGAAMHTRFAAEGKDGVTSRSGGEYSAWWNGGLRTTAYFHNQIGLLTETIGSPTPTEIPVVPERQLASADLPYPIRPQVWRFRQSIDYSITANRAVLDAASRFRETFLFNAYRMGMNSIERGSQDWWTIMPRRLGALTSEGRSLRDPSLRDPRGYILAADQPDFLTATKFVDALLKAGIRVHRATASFEVSRRRYPAGSYVVKTAQAFRPHVLDMFEPQDYPDPPSPEGFGGASVDSGSAPPPPPYDIAGWTLAFQMGVKFERVLSGFDGPFEEITSATPPAGVVSGPADPAGYLVSHHQNDAFIVVNRLLRAGEDVYWLRDRTVGSAPRGAGAIYISARHTTLPILAKAASELGLSFAGVRARPAGGAIKLQPARIGLWDRYGGASTSGWTRWLLERYEFPFERVFAQELDAGGLAKRYDVLILTDEAVPSTSPGAPRDVPPEYQRTTGTMTWARTVPQLGEFVREGGTLVLIGDSAAIAGDLGVPVTTAVVDAEGRPRSREQFYIPGSVLRVRVDNTTPLGYGFEGEVDLFFEHSPVFRLARDTASSSARRVAWFASASPLRSGWARGQQYLEGGIAVLDAPVERGRVLLFGPEIAFRAQSHGTFKFLFNAIHYSAAELLER